MVFNGFQLLLMVLSQSNTAFGISLFKGLRNIGSGGAGWCLCQVRRGLVKPTRPSVSQKVTKTAPKTSKKYHRKKLQEKNQENPYFTLNYQENSGFPGVFFLRK